MLPRRTKTESRPSLPWPSTGRDGGESAESVFGSLAAETQATYGPDERA